jgi:hypothetical protein
MWIRWIRIRIRNTGLKKLSVLFFGFTAMLPTLARTFWPVRQVNLATGEKVGPLSIFYIFNVIWTSTDKSSTFLGFAYH